MEEAPENGKQSSHSAHTTGMNERNAWYIVKIFFKWNKKGASRRIKFMLQTHERGNENENTTEPKYVTVS